MSSSSSFLSRRLIKVCGNPLNWIIGNNEGKKPLSKVIYLRYIQRSLQRHDRNKTRFVGEKSTTEQSAMSSSSSKEEEDPSNACRFCGRQQLPRDAFNHIKNTLHHLSPPELERRGFCCVCLNEQNILWQLITDHDDIFQMHIVEKLNGSDLKFLGQANSESRLALRRSKNVVTVPVKFDGTNE